MNSPESVSMSESNYNWVCFDCRFAIRQAKTSEHIPRCASCNSKCVCVGYKLKIPGKSDTKGWEKLREISREMDQQTKEIQKKYHETRIAQLTEQIETLSAREHNKDREKLIAQLQEELDRLLLRDNP